ncbi:MAG: hypothetical protein M1815_003190 [Lichina confinis]|nr:MAG: hypothetical protein M1815_003190 [Lichina confinis]
MDVSRDINRTPRPRSRSSTRTLTPSARARSVSPWRATHSKLNLRQFGRSRRGPARRRWDAVTRTTVEWDSLAHVGRSSFVPVPNRLQDPDLWDANGDCHVYLQNPEQAGGEPSFRLPFDVIHAAECTPLLEHFAICKRLRHRRRSYARRSLDEDGAAGAPRVQFALYVPAPAYCAGKQMQEYHIGTRNFFAWMFCKPLVGYNLGEALLSLSERMMLFRPAQERNVPDIYDYLDEQRYLDFRECPDHALGVLLFAEQHQLWELWTDAFAHCVGMSDQLESSPGFAPVSRSTKLLVHDATLEMDVRIDHAERRLTNFLDEELSSSRLGLGHGARAHLERFRSFLISHYVAKFGYWPPRQHDRVTGSDFSQLGLRTMYFDFRSLYEHLVDGESTTSIERNKPADGGICVLQNLMAFDKRNGFTSLDHPLPLVPAARSAHRGPRSFKALGSSFGRAAKLDKRLEMMNALAAASNSNEVATAQNPLVPAYIEFENECCAKQEERVSPSDARKVRWILIYCILQTLISATKIPVEVRDTEGVSYNLCCRVPVGAVAHSRTMPGPLKSAAATARLSAASLVSARPSTNTTLVGEPDSRDCVNSSSSSSSSSSNAGDKYDDDYDAARRQSSDTVASELHPDNEYAMSRPLLSSKSVADLATEQRRSRRSGAFCEILVYGYGNGLNAANVNCSSSSSLSSPSSVASSASLSSMATVTPASSASASPLTARKPALPASPLASVSTSPSASASASAPHPPNAWPLPLPHCPTFPPKASVVIFDVNDDYHSNPAVDDYDGDYGCQSTSDDHRMTVAPLPPRPRQLQQRQEQQPQQHQYSPPVFPLVAKRHEQQRHEEQSKS